ncbi:hypothetical protein NUW54_g10899 [Trametes sanguinea]|uniref:Uncharacterized protein n=1 Tax=Trametes sanguinea TaxID=158606 RepID=A0ACC1NSA3_9APHY|nr:hypothetical protein NUW54_g10899 [Trametes sanguinea]
MRSGGVAPRSTSRSAQAYRNRMASEPEARHRPRRAAARAGNRTCAPNGPSPENRTHVAVTTSLTCVHTAATTWAVKGWIFAVTAAKWGDGNELSSPKNKAVVFSHRLRLPITAPSCARSEGASLYLARRRRKWEREGLGKGLEERLEGLKAVPSKA